MPIKEGMIVMKKLKYILTLLFIQNFSLANVYGMFQCMPTKRWFKMAPPYFGIKPSDKNLSQSSVERLVTLPQLIKENKFSEIEKLSNEQPKEFVAALNYCDASGITPFHYAAEFSSPKMIGLLSRSVGNINKKAVSGFSPLFSAIKGAKVENVLSLLLRNADIKMPDEDGFLPLHRAIALYKSKETTPAMWQNQMDIIKLIAHHITKFYRLDIDFHLARNGETALHIAARYGHNDVIDFLCDSKMMDIDQQDYSDETPLFEAAFNKNFETVKHLIEDHDANPNATNSEHKTPLIVVTEKIDELTETMHIAKQFDDIKSLEKLHAEKAELIKIAEYLQQFEEA